MRKVILLVGLVAVHLGGFYPIWGQTCTGTLGENIFADGDFGVGIANIVPFDPQIAPGYIYQTNPPPNDGFYTITNDIGQWPSNFGWAQIQDNSPNPFGYMMVVNASFDPGLFYEETVTGLCENTLYEFSADIYNLIQGENLIRPNVDFLIDGTVVYNTGNIPENFQWNTYGFTFSTAPGQTSVTLSLANNAPGGIGNDIALDNISFRPCGPEALILPTSVLTICPDGNPLQLNATVQGNQYPTPRFQWQTSTDQGATWTDIPGATVSLLTISPLSSGTYWYRFLLANDPANLTNSRCRVISNVKIIEVVPKFFTVVDSLCEGRSYAFGGNTLTTSGTYQDSLVSSLGCDSIVTLNLTFLPDPGIQADLELNDPSCDYLDDGTILLGTISFGNPPYSAFLNGQVISPGLVDGLGASPYIVNVVDRFGCSFDTVVFLQRPPPFSVELGPDWEISLGDSIELNPTGSAPIAQYAWRPDDWVNCVTDCRPVWALPRATGNLTIVATSEAGCVAEDSIFVQVNAVRQVYIPTAFTPNDDGLNDVFSVWGDFPSAQQVDELLIYDRWGGIIFARTNMPINDPTQGWDGTAGGKPVAEGVYPYVARIRFLDGQVFVRSGSLTLVR